MKGTIPLDAIDAPALADYAGSSGTCSPRATPEPGGASMIAGYAGRSDKLTKALARFALRVRDQTEADHALLVAAVKAGRLPVLDGALEQLGSAFRPR